MTIAGIICEYNPLHEGHVYHMNETRRRTGCDYIVCVMAGAFMQRGEPAFLDKFVRAECALRAGADAVLELPALYAVRPAELYARGGVDILRAVGADFLSFGSETDDLDFLLSLSGALLDESGEVSRQVREGLRAGKTLARARGEALARALGVEPECLNQPNLALAAEYLKRILETNAPMRPVCVKRTSPYHADEPSASASALRRAFLAGDAETALARLPECTREIVRRELPFAPDARVWGALALWSIRRLSPEAMDALPDAGEGLGRRLWNMAQTAGSAEELTELVKCKRYTRARISRLIASAALELPANVPEEIPYVRLLGFRRASSELIAELKKRSGGRLCADPAALENTDAFRLERRATDLRGLLTASPAYRQTGRDRTARFLVV